MRFRKLVSLGSGGMARVHLAVTEESPEFTKLVVVKELREELVDDGEFVRMFRDEARVSARLSHPNIVQTHSVVEAGSKLALVMEYVEGLSLAGVTKRVADRGFPLPLYVRVLSEVLSGLHYAHELVDFDGSALQLVHRDVTPHNVMIDYGGHVKLLDFGIAKVRGALSQTVEGMIKGKIAYMAPENILGKAVDRRCDVFAVGVMLWEALTGARAGGRRPEAEVAAMRVGGTEPLASALAPNAPEMLLEACARAMASDPAERYPTAAELRLALETYLAAEGQAASIAALAQFMCDHFSDERDQIRKVVAECAAAPSRPSHRVALLVEEPSSSTVDAKVRETTLASSVANDRLEPLRPWHWLAAAIAVAGLLTIYGLSRAGAAPPSVASTLGLPSVARGASLETAPWASSSVPTSADAQPDRNLETMLDRSSQPDKPGGAKSARWVRGPRLEPVVTPAVPSVDAQPPASVVGAPTPTARKPRDIDENDPYKK